jgi:hypothetical protein
MYMLTARHLHEALSGQRNSLWPQDSLALVSDCVGEEWQPSISLFRDVVTHHL